MFEHQSRQVDYGSANDGFLDEEAPDLGPLQEAAEAAELAEAMSGLTASSGEPLPARDPLRPLACAIARALTEAGFTLHHCARHHPRYPARRSVPAARRCWPCPGEQGRSGCVLDHTRPAVAGLVPLARVPRHSGVMNGALGHVLGVLGFQVAPFGSGGAHIVTAGPVISTEPVTSRSWPPRATSPGSPTQSFPPSYNRAADNGDRYTENGCPGLGPSTRGCGRQRAGGNDAMLKGLPENNA